MSTGNYRKWDRDRYIREAKKSCSLSDQIRQWFFTEKERCVIDLNNEGHYPNKAFIYHLKDIIDHRTFDNYRKKYYTY